MLKKIALLCLICCSAGAAYAYDIKNALADAYHNNDNLKAERMRYKQKLVEADRGKYRLMPDVSLSAVSGYTDYMDYNEKINSINFNAGYSIPLGGGKFHELKASGASQELASARLAQAEAATLLSAAKAYIRYIMALDAEKISKDTLNLMSIYFDAAKQKAEVGSLSKIDMAKARQQLASANADAVKARSQLCEAGASFLHVIGIEPQADSNSFEEPDPITTIPAVYQEALDVANQNNILLRVAKADEQLAHYELRSAQSALLPTLNLAFTLRQNIDSYYEGTDKSPLIKTSSFMASLNVPIFQEGMSGYAKVKQARLNSSRAFYSHKEAISDMKEQVKVAIENVAINKAFIDAATEAVDAATVNRDAVKEAYEAQAAIESDALKAEHDLVAERLKLLDAKTRYLLSAYELLSNCGLLTFEYLQIE